jgi:hypothetical protein
MQPLHARDLPGETQRCHVHGVLLVFRQQRDAAQRCQLISVLASYIVRCRTMCTVKARLQCCARAMVGKKAHVMVLCDTRALASSLQMEV